MSENIVFKGELYARTSAERAADAQSLGSVVRDFFESLALPPAEKSALLHTYRDAVQTAITNIRGNEERPLTEEEKTKILNRVFAVLTHTAAGMERIQEFKNSLLNPELIQGNQVEAVMAGELEWVKEGSLSESRRLAVVQMDMDDFKPVNDQYGHDVGDKLLQSLGTSLQAAIRPEDTAIHFHGDEFGVILRFTFDTTTSEIDTVIQQVLERITQTTTRNVRNPAGQEQSISVGYTVADSSDTRDIETLLIDADTAVRISKLQRIQGIIKGQTLLPSHERVIRDTQIDSFTDNLSEEDRIIVGLLLQSKRSVSEFAAHTGVGEGEIITLLYETLHGLKK